MTKYNICIRFLHLIIAIGVILQLSIGFFFDDVFSQWHGSFFMTMHKSIGLSLAILIITLIIVRLVSCKRPYPSNISTINRVLATIVHWGLYLSVFSMSSTGFIASQLFHSPWQFFYWFNVPLLLPQNISLGSKIFSWHPWIAYILLALVLIHILAALYHRFIIKDKIMQKMF